MHANAVRPTVIKLLQRQLAAGTIDNKPTFSVEKTHEAGISLGKRRREKFRITLERGPIGFTGAYDVDAARLRKKIREELDIDVVIVQPV